MKRSKNRVNRRLSVCLLTAACIIFLSCNVREPGCLDIEASNFDFEAEKHDPLLCMYPDLVLNVFYQWADSSLQTGFLYRNAAGMHYAVHSIQILFSGFALQKDAGEVYTIDDRVSLVPGDCISGDRVDVPDDFLFADRSAFNYPIGPFRESGTIHQVRTTVGVSDELTPMCLESLPDNHLLRGSRAAYDPDLGDFALGRFILSRDSINAVRDTFFAYGAAQTLEFEVSRTFRQGRRDTLFMAIDFHQIFDAVDLNLDKSIVSHELASRIGPAVDIH